MRMSEGIFDELERRANELDGLSTSSSTKYDDLKAWLQSEFGAPASVCFLSEFTKQWTPRVGQALMGFPRLLILLVQGEVPESAAARLGDLHRYVSGLQASVVLTGTEGAWKVAHVAGPHGRTLRAAPEAEMVKPGDVPSSPIEYAHTPSADEASARRRPGGAFLDLSSMERAEATWRILIGRGEIDVDEAIRTTANALRDEGQLEYERLRRDGPAYASIEEAINWGRRHLDTFDRPRRGTIRAVLRSADDYTREAWRDCVLGALDAFDDWVDRDELVRASAERAIAAYGLEMQRFRTGGHADTGIRSAINGLIRIGQLERDGAQLLRRALGSRRARVAVPNGDAPDAVAQTGDPSHAVTGPAADSEVVESGPSTALLRALVGEIPGECEAMFTSLLASEIWDPERLGEAVAAHLAEFERQFDAHPFLDLDGAEELARQSRALLALWPSFSDAHMRLAQAAILYFVESDEVDDDFRIGGLRTDKLVMAAVSRVVLAEPADYSPNDGGETGRQP